MIAPPEIEGELRAMCTAALESVPELHDALPQLVEHFASHARGGVPPSRAYAGDLALAFAAACGIPAAQRRLDALLTASVARAVARIDSTRAFADVVAQELRGRLLLGDRPKIAQYSGRGPLAGWLRTAATRTALNLRRGHAIRNHEPLGSGLGAANNAPELEILRTRHRRDFEEAVRTALGRLSARERAILSLNVGDGMSSDRIAALYRVGRSTAKRWLVAARAVLADETKRELRARLQLSSAEYESIAAGVRSAVDVSVLRILGDLEEG
jgi:RNA polymerase sigma-70 factor, ECF subfamily